MRIIKGMRLGIIPIFVLVFVLDCVTPLGIAVPVLYVVPVLMTALTASLEWSFGAALIATIVTYCGYLYSPSGGNVDEGTTNRLIASVLIWACVLLGWLLGYVREEIQRFYNENNQTD
ncbi:hypothetical protein [Nitrospira sp. Nam74]